MKQQLSESVPDQYHDRVIWAGFHPVDRVRSLMHLSDIFVLPSRYEPWALVVNEALATGLCCMVSQVVAAGVEILEENDTTNGPLVFKHDDEAALLEALVTVTDLKHMDQYKEYCQKQYEKYRITMDSAEMTKIALNL
jgi:glycosyltransferase involved in cell wall biosynthesis